MYGSTTHGGGGDVVFKLWPTETPDMVSLNRLGNAMQVTFTGTPSCQYKLFRSTDLTHWSVLATITMPAGASYTYVDATPSVARAFYRAAWVP